MIDRKFSIIVLTFNSERYIKRCLKSILDQTYSNFEVIIVDNGSKDSTKKIVSSFDKRFKWTECLNSDMGMARNFGINQAKGEYICFLDSDDYYLNNKLEIQFDYINKYSADVFFNPAYHYRTEKSNRLGLKKDRNNDISLIGFLKGKNFNLGGMTVAKNVFKIKKIYFGENEKGRYGEEWRLQLKMAFKNVKMKIIKEPLHFVELRSDSHTQWDRQWIMKKLYHEEIIEYIDSYNLNINSKELENIISSAKLKLIIAYLIASKKDEAKKLVKSIQQNYYKTVSIIFILLYSTLSKNLIKKLIIYLWLSSQNNSFHWQKPDENLKRQFNLLNEF